jgi:uncharacterized membrane protein YedE/YeeE
MELILGLITGILFGVLLQRAEVLRFDRQVGFLCLRDMTILKFMLSAVFVGMIGINFFDSAGIIDLKVKTTQVAAQLIGGGLFGLGWALLGYCPGTAVGAVAEGRTDAFWGILGMIIGAMIFAHIYPLLSDTILRWGDLGKVTIPEMIHMQRWVVIPLFGGAIVFLLHAIRDK